MNHKKIYEDHLGNRYESLDEMCKHYNIAKATYYSRLSSGWSLERALTETTVKDKHKKCKDHLGRVYNNVDEMCKQYNISKHTFYKRKSSGWSLEDSLTTPVRGVVIPIYVDHLGNRYNSISEMCKQYNISKLSFRSRLKRGWSLERALTTPIKNTAIICRDHRGNEYNSMEKMCNTYGISRALLYNRINHGWDLEKALTTPVRKTDLPNYVDSNKSKYASVKDLCKRHNISKATLYARLNHGWDLERAITTPVKSVSKVYKDHLGNSYESLQKMCNIYGIDTAIFKARIGRGLSLKDALTKPIHKEMGSDHEE